MFAEPGWNRNVAFLSDLFVKEFANKAIIFPVSKHLLLFTITALVFMGCLIAILVVHMV